MSFYPFVPREISVLAELILGHLCYHLTDVPPQPNSPPDPVPRWGRPDRENESSQSRGLVVQNLSVAPLPVKGKADGSPLTR